MYSIETIRKLTPYVKECVYAWVFEKIQKGEYRAYGRKARELLERIKFSGAVTKEQYEQFSAYCDFLPFDYIIQKGKVKPYIPVSRRASDNKIITDEVKNYLVDFCGFKIPIGFMQDFYEDDYELQCEVSKLYSDYLGAALCEFCERSAKACYSFENDMEQLGNTQGNIFPKKGRTIRQHVSRMWMHITNALTIALPVFVLFTVLETLNLLLGGNPEICYDFIVNMKYSLTAVKALTPYEWLTLTVSIAMLFIDLIILISSTLKLILFYITFLAVRCRVALISLGFTYYYKIARIGIQDYFKSLTSKLSCVSDSKATCVATKIKTEYFTAPPGKSFQNPILCRLSELVAKIKFESYRRAHKFVKLYSFEKLTNASRILKSKTWASVNLISGKNKSLKGLFALVLITAVAVAITNEQIADFLMGFIG